MEPTYTTALHSPVLELSLFKDIGWNLITQSQPQSQTIGPITFAPTSLNAGSVTVASASATSGLSVIFNTATPAICTVNGVNVTGVSVGTCTINADQPGNANYLAAPQITRSIAVGIGTQTIGTISFSPANLNAGSTAVAIATANSGLPVSFTSATPAFCTVSGVNGSTIAGIAIGTCAIVANQAGNANYFPAPQITQNISVGQSKSSQTIGSITINLSSLIVGASATARAIASSGLPVTFATSTTGVCTLSGSTITAVSLGTCAVTADQAGNASFTAAPQVTQNFLVMGTAAALSNVSTRGLVLTGNNVMIGGFIVTGTTPLNVLIRARGPSLAAFGVPGVLLDPVLNLYSGQTVIASNDNWGSASNAAAISASGLAPTDSREAAILITLNPGAYTAIVTGAGGTTGVAIVEALAL
jgi:hypothetical protein